MMEDRIISEIEAISSEMLQGIKKNLSNAKR